MSNRFGGLHSTSLFSTAGFNLASEVAFLYALDADLQAFKGAGAVPVGNPISVCGRQVQRLDVGPQRVDAVKMGSGAVETAVTAAALLARFHCDLAVSLGPVGALGDTLEVGAWYGLGAVTPYQKGAHPPEGFQMTGALKGFSGPIVLPALPGVFLDRPTAPVASGEVFVASDARRESLRTETGAAAVDMNAFGLLTACAAADVPHVGWRVVSDRADNGAGEAFRQFVAAYKGEGGTALAALIRALPANPEAPESYPALKKLMNGEEGSAGGTPGGKP